MIPINYDAVISALCVIAGLCMLVKLGVFGRKKYAPALGSITVFIGLIAWCIIGLVSLSGIFERPAVFYSEGWTGSWGYTASRFFMMLMWFLALIHIHIYAPACRHTDKTKL